MTHPLSSANISIFSMEISKFCYIEKYRCRLHFDTYFLILLTFLEPLKIVFINMVTILITWAKLATLDLVKIKLFWNKGYDVMVSIHDVIKRVKTKGQKVFGANSYICRSYRGKSCLVRRPFCPLSRIGLKEVKYFKEKTDLKSLMM